MANDLPARANRETPLRIEQDLRLLFEAREALERPHEVLLAARATVLCGLPFRPVENRSWIKEARLGEGEKLVVTFTAMGNHLLPYGADRALFAWIQTRAYRGDGVVTLDFLSEYLRTFGLRDTGSGYALLRDRLERLKNVAVQIQHTTSEGVHTLNSSPISMAVTPQDPEPLRRRFEESSGQQSLLIRKPWGFLLNASFWDYLRANPVPLPLPLMRVFHNQPKAWDLASFATYRCYVASGPSVVPWQGLRQVLGSSDGNDRQLRRTLAQALEQVKTVLPDLPATFLPACQGLAVAPWRPGASAATAVDLHGSAAGPALGQRRMEVSEVTSSAGINLPSSRGLARRISR